MNIQKLSSYTTYKNFDFNSLTNTQKYSLNQYLEDKPGRTSVPDSLFVLLMNDESVIDYPQRMQKLKDLGKDTTSELAYELRYGKEKADAKRSARLNSMSKLSSKDYWVDKIGQAEADKKFNRTNNSLPKMIKRYGSIDGQKRYDVYLKKWKHSHSLAGYIDKYGPEEGKLKYDEKIKRYSFSNSLPGYIEKHGIEKGTELFNNRIKKQAYKVSLAGYIDKYGPIEGPKKIHKIKNNLSLDKFILRYGEKEGNRRYKVHCKTMSRNSTLPGYIDKYGPEEGSKRYNQKLLNVAVGLSKAFKGGYSTISQELFWNIFELVANNRSCMFAERSDKEFFLHDNVNHKMYFYDFKYDNKIIEFNGEYWHANPNKYNASDILYSGRTAFEIWERENAKLQFTREQGYEVLIIWEGEFEADPKGETDRCIEFLKG